MLMRWWFFPLDSLYRVQRNVTFWLHGPAELLLQVLLVLLARCPCTVVVVLGALRVSTRVVCVTWEHLLYLYLVGRLLAEL